MTRLLRSVLLASAFFSVGAMPPPSAMPGAFSHDLAVSDSELDAARGGFLLPNGVQIAMAVQTDTRVDGQLLLRSTFVVDTGAPQVTVYGPAPGSLATQPAIPARPAIPAIPSNGAQVIVSTSRGGDTTIQPQFSPPVTNIGVSLGQAPTADASAAADNLVQLPVVVGGPAVQTDGGLVSASALPAGVRVSLQGDQLNVQNLLGQALGTVIINTANNRTIDTSVVVNIDVKNATPALLGSSILRTADLAIDAARLGAH